MLPPLALKLPADLIVALDLKPRHLKLSSEILPGDVRLFRYLGKLLFQSGLLRIQASRVFVAVSSGGGGIVGWLMSWLGGTNGVKHCREEQQEGFSRNDLSVAGLQEQFFFLF